MTRRLLMDSFWKAQNEIWTRDTYIPLLVLLGFDRSVIKVLAVQTARELAEAV